jgi:hypothetical protein
LVTVAAALAVAGMFGVGQSAAASVTSPSAAAAAAVPITHVCVSKSTSQLFYRSTCASVEDTVAVTPTSPQFSACYQPVTGVTRKVASTSSCNPAVELPIAEVPADAPVSLSFCVSPFGGPLSFIGVAPSCETFGLSTVVIGPHNLPPVANGDAYFLVEDGFLLRFSAGGVLANDVDQDPIGAQLVTGPAHAALFALNANGAFLYVPAANFNGFDSFSYRARDSFNEPSAVVSVLIIVGAVNDAPQALPGSRSTSEDTPLALNLGALASDVETSDANLSYQIVSQPAHGTATASTYTPDANYNGPDSLTYRVTDTGECLLVFCDAPKTSSTQTVSITVNPVNDAPTGVALSNDSVAENQPVGTTVGTLSAADQDAGDTHTFALVAGTGSTDNASFQITGSTLKTNAVFDFEAKSSYSIRVRATDSGSLTFEKQFTITVTNVNEAPTDLGLSPSSVAENEPVGTTVGTLSAADQDAGDTHTFALVAGTGSTDNASFQITGSTLKTNAVFDFEAKSSYSIRVRVTDSGGLTFEKQLTITVTDVVENAPPVAAAQSVSTNEDTAKTITLSASDADGDDPLTFAIATGPTHGGLGSIGAVTCNHLTPNVCTADVVYTPSANYHGPDSFTYTANDGQVDSAPGTVSITVNSVNDAPVAGADSYGNAVGNTLAVLGTTGTGPHIVLTGNVLIANDTDPDAGDILAAVAETVASTGGGSATINANGSFTFLPGVGDKNQNDTFTYHVTDGIATSAGTVTVSIANVLVWYVNGSAGAGDGRSNGPFNSLASVNGAGGAGDADGSSDVLFLYSGNYSGGLPLETNQRLIGQPHGLVVNPGSGDVTLVAAGGTNPNIANAGGAGIALANGVEVQRVNVNLASGAGVTGSAITNATIGANTSIGGASGNAFELSGAASGTIAVGSDITAFVGHSISVANRSGGSVTFSGAVTDFDEGILLNSNTGATVNLTGGVTVTLNKNDAFTATGGGTVNVTGAANTLSTSTGIALKVQNTTIGASGLTFRSISASGAANGIILSSTGASGGLTVTGTGTAGSGGTITNIAGADAATNGCAGLGSPAAGVGIYLNSTTSPSFSYMNFPGTFGNFGILGYSVNGFTLANTTMSGTYGDNVNQDEDTVHFCTLTGSASISNSTISNGAESNLRVVNASGSLNRLTLQSSTIGLNQTNGDIGTLFQANGGTFNATVQDTTFQGSRGVPFRALLPLAGATMDLDFGSPGHGNTVHNTHGNIQPFTPNLSVIAIGTLTFDINSNHFDTAAAAQARGGVSISAGATGNASGYFRNNTIGNSGVADSGSSGNMDALHIDTQTGGDLTIVVDNNTLYQWGGSGLVLNAFTGQVGNPPTVNATVTNNTIAEPGTFGGGGAPGFLLVNGQNPGDNFTTCLRFAGNLVNEAATGAASDVHLLQQFDTKVQLPGYTGAANGTSGVPTVAGYIQGLNPTGPPTATSSSSTAAGGGFFNTLGGAACPVPAFP